MGLALAGPAHGATLPQGFGETTLAEGFSAPTAIDFAPDGRMFIAHKEGLVRVRRPDGSIRRLVNFADDTTAIGDSVNSYGDRGLLGLAVDEDFSTNNYLYLLYTRELDPFDPDLDNPTASRLTRVTVNADNTVKDPTVILGTESTAPCPLPDNSRDCIPADWIWSTVGAVRSDPTDGSLWISTGDAHAPTVDELSYRPYDTHSLAGKLIHVDRQGNGLPGHPFCPGDTDLTHVCTKIHATGFRSNFRFSLRPGGTPVQGDVGHVNHEELNLVEAGKNYGWPCYEGPIHTPMYAAEPECQDEYAKEGTPEELEGPAWTYSNEGQAIIVGPVYGGANYPATYVDRVFVSDYVDGWVKTLTINDDDEVVGVSDFGTDADSIVDLEAMPNGDLAWVDVNLVGAGAVRRITYANGNKPPTPVATADRQYGDAPLDVQFTGSDSTDPEGDALTYEWDFGDGSPRSSAADPLHTYASEGLYTARLTVDDGFDRDPNATVKIRVGDPPVARIEGPPDGWTYRAGEPVPLTGTGQDPEDGTLSGASLSWRGVLVHGTHNHVANPNPKTGSTSSLVPRIDHDADTRYKLILTAEDSSGQIDTDQIEVHPETAELSLHSSPPGAAITYSGRGPFTAPLTRMAGVGYRATIEAADLVTHQGRSYRFAEWSDGGPRRHEIRVPPGDSALVAQYERVPPPDTMILSGPSGLVTTSTPSFSFISDDPAAGFECRLDQGSFDRCSPPFGSPFLPDGPHEFSVRATDPFVGNPDPTPATRGFAVDATAPEPRFTASSPRSPGNHNSPRLIGSAADAISVSLYTMADCSGPPEVSGSAESFASSGLPVSVPDDSLTEFRVVATDAAGNTGPCSGDFLRYREDSTAPGVDITRGAPREARDETPTFRFESSELRSSFQCNRDGIGWRRCGSPHTFRRLNPGWHVVRIRAVDRAGNVGERVRDRFRVIE